MGVADHKVARVEGAFHSVEGDEFTALLGVAHYDLSALDLVDVKAVEGLPHAVEQVVGDVDYVVDRAHSDHVEGILEPLGRLGHSDACDCDATVAGTCLGVVDTHLDASVGRAIRVAGTIFVPNTEYYADNTNDLVRAIRFFISTIL